MKQLAILLAVGGLMAFTANDAFAQKGHGGGGYRGGNGYNGGSSSAWGFSIGNGYNSFSYAQGPRGGYGFGGGFAQPVYAAPVVPVAPVYAAPVAPVWGAPAYGAPWGGSGFSFGYSNFGGGCRHHR